VQEPVVDLAEHDQVVELRLPTTTSEVRYRRARWPSRLPTVATLADQGRRGVDRSPRAPFCP
jgi:hypothetical protein